MELQLPETNQPAFTCWLRQKHPELQGLREREWGINLTLNPKPLGIGF